VHPDNYAPLAEMDLDAARRNVDDLTNTALTGATYDVDGGQHLVPA
jgi:hypothetical protein